MTAFIRFLALAAPWFGLVAVGYALGKIPGWRRTWSDGASKIVFAVPLPALLIHMLGQPPEGAHVDARLLVAFFGACAVVFVLGRLVAAFAFKLDGVAQSVFALGGVFSNNVFLGIPLVRLLLGPQALPAAALVVTFNALILWTLVTVSVEWARHGALSFAGLGKTAKGLLTNPLILAILGGSAIAAFGLTFPPWLERTLALLGGTAGPAALLALGMGIAAYGLGAQRRVSLAICVLKLGVQPLVVWIFAVALGLPALERDVVVFLAALSVGTNVYLMASQFESLQGPVAGSLVLSTPLAAFTAPLALALVSGSR